jgi:hypothetical protein
MFITKKKMSKCIEAGRTAIEARMLAVITLPRANTEADEAEMITLYTLYKQYNAVMSPAESSERAAENRTID